MAEDPEGGGEKTEDPTSRKLEKAREEGQVPKSMEIPSVFVLMSCATSLYFFGFYSYRSLVSVVFDTLNFNSIPVIDKFEIVNLYGIALRQILIACLPVMAAAIVMGLASNFAQVGFAVSWKAIEPKLSKLNPISGFKEKFSSRALIEFIKSILKITIIFTVVYLSIMGEMSRIINLYDNSIAQIFLFILKETFSVFLIVCIIMLLVAILDYVYQRWKFLDDQKMTKKEMKDEAKQTEGDPHVKSRIRQLQVEAARKRMMADVPDADVVVTNPTRLAVALKYDKIVMDAPGVVAKGAGPVAENIRRIAKENNIPLVENKELARNLYKEVDIGESIPSQFFQTVAELLAYVYKLKGKRK
ncbi:MAG: flagellar biosynthesis protein FlhB [Desulfobacteraceae bacterium]|nr:flagellar biosynthesis protein FlhB [Desulfobacteraceae bacterium]